MGLVSAEKKTKIPIEPNECDRYFCRFSDNILKRTRLINCISGYIEESEWGVIYGLCKNNHSSTHHSYVYFLCEWSIDGLAN